MSFLPFEFLSLQSGIFSKIRNNLGRDEAGTTLVKKIAKKVRIFRNGFYLDIRLFFWFFRLLPSLEICLHPAFSRG